MADVTVTNVKLNEDVEVKATTGAATQTIPFDKDQNIIVTVASSDATDAKVTFKALGNMAGGKDKVVTVKQNKEHAIMLESARFKNPTDQAVTVTISGATVTNVKIRTLRVSLGDIQTS